MMETKKDKKGKKGANHAQNIAGVAAFVLFLPVFRRLERTYRFNRVSSMVMILLAHNGYIGVTRVCMLFYGYKDGNSYRSAQYSLALLKERGLADSVGGKWSLTEKGYRELGLID